MFRRLFEWLDRRKRDKLKRKILDLEATVAARDREIAVLRAENENLAAVLARDRLRVQAETSEYGRRKAVAESGNGHATTSV